MSQSKVASVGARYLEAFKLDSNGDVNVNTASATPVQGTVVFGLKTVSVTDPEPQRINHYGDDETFAQDSLPATEIASMNITTAIKNIDFDAMAEGNLVRTINGNKMRAGDSNKKGSEPQLFLSYYKQALDSDPDSSSFGKLRQWQLRVFPSVRVTPAADSAEQTNVDNEYRCTPTKVSETPWAEAFTEANWGNTKASYIDIVCDYQPRWNFYKGNGTLTAFDLSFAPFSSAHLTVWVDGTETTPSSVDTGANPAFTLSGAAANNALIAALIETDDA